MPKFRMSRLRANNILELHKQRRQINLDPPYQRLSVWDDDKKAKFIDSIINGVDTPKLYFHDVRGQSQTNTPYRFSVIDGKQRLLALFEFMENKLRLPDDFKYFDNELYDARGLTYNELLEQYPLLRAHFDGYEAPVVVVEADNEELIEELFWRLNVQMPLTAPEKRNALGGPLPLVIRKIGLHRFFRESCRIRTDRFQHLDLAAKFLYICHAGGVVETKKNSLDDFVETAKKARDSGQQMGTAAYLGALEEQTTTILEKEHNFFGQSNPLLISAGRNVLYFHIFRRCAELQLDVPFSLRYLERFNADVTVVRKKSQSRGTEGLEGWESELLSFDLEKQSSNQKSAIERQYRYLGNYMRQKYQVEMPELT